MSGSFISHFDCYHWSYILIGWLILVIVIAIGIYYGYDTLEQIGFGISIIQDVYEEDKVQAGIEIGSKLVDRGIDLIEKIKIIHIFYFY